MDFDPRDCDSRDEERFGPDRDRGSRRDSDYHDRDEDDLRLLGIRVRDRGDDDTRELGRGPGDDSRQANADEHSPDPREDARWPDRDRETRERDIDPRDVFTRDVDLPRGLEREIVRDALAVGTGTP